MPIDLQKERDNIYRLEIWGQLRKAELKKCEEKLAGEISQVGPVKLLFNLAGFEGWETRSDWNDLTFFVKHGDSIQQIAIVGDDKWKNQAMMFAGAGLRKAPVEYFPEDALSTARTWLSS
jgi:hypothetical protein